MSKIIQTLAAVGSIALAAVPLLIASTSAYAASFIG